ncbi:MAG: Secretion system C-terminal sorting domain, partial [Bacteroidota bacterium]
GQFQVFDLTETPFGYMFAGTHTVTNTNHNDFTGMVSLSGVITNQFSLGDTPLFSDNRVQQIAYVPQQGACAFGIQVHNTGTFSESYDLNMGYADALYGYWLGWPSTLILNQGYDYCGNIRPTSDGGYVAVGMNSTLNDGQNQLNGGANVFVLKIDAAGGGFIKTDTVFTVHQLVGLEPITAQAHSIQVYPNPMSNEIHVHFDAQEAVQIGLYNAQGQLISSGLFFNEALFETTQLEAGTYILKVGTQGYPLLKY